MKVIVNGIEVDVDDRHLGSPLMWAFRFVFGPDDSEQANEVPDSQALQTATVTPERRAAERE